MQNIQKTRFIAANYSNLQGLKSVPLGLLLLMVVLWANGQTGRATDLSLPILFALAMILLFGIVYRYYRVRFGKVESTPEKKRLEIFLGGAGAVLGLGAFIVDVTYKLPVSMVGLMFAASTVAEYFRMQWYAPGHYMVPFSLAAFVLLVVISILPLLGAGQWWLLLGLRAQLYGVLVVTAVLLVVYGLFQHWFFVRQLPSEEK